MTGMGRQEAAAVTPRHDGEVLARADGCEVIDCRDCGFAHLSPLPDPELLQKRYREHFYQTEKPDYFARTEADEPWLQLQYGDRLATLADLLGPGRRSLLDIGCGPGSFLATAAAHGWTGVGVEPSPVAADYARARGLQVVEGVYPLEPGDELPRCDAVHLSEVLEHVSDPARMLRAVYRQLAPGGVVCVSVPNDFNILQKVLRDKDHFSPWWVAPRHHVNYFSFASLSALLRSCGFEVVHQEASFPMEFFLLMGNDYVADPALGRECHRQRVRLEMRLAAAGCNDLRRRLYQHLATLGLGRIAVVYALRRQPA